ncbi:MAG: hypothetical protein RI554_05255 [Trueperaceae bacterium]|nr:hypothetical protein [Trueperaceae bacterium]
MANRFEPERMVHGGYALARTPQGEVVLLRGALPGEVVEADVERRGGVLRGRVTRVVRPSPDRVEAPRHPGLDLGFAAYEAQLGLKRDVLADAAHRAGLALPEGVPDVRPSPRTWGYRSVVQPAVQAGRLGFRREGATEIVPLDGDPTAMPSVRAAWDAVAELPPPSGVEEVVIRGTEAGEALVAWIADAPASALLDPAHALVRAGVAGVARAPRDARGRFRSGKERLAGARELRERYGRVEVSVSATAFAQPNPAAAGALFDALADLAPGGARAVELYAGSGVGAMHLADRYDEVVAVEVAHELVARGRRDVARAGLAGVRVERGDARRASLAGADTVLLDPPRAGASKGLRDAVTASPAATVLYVACDVATWARDVAAWTAQGWRLVHVEPFDFQPHTHHLELLSRLDR